ncbi:MAG: hypothetical protein WC375_06130 [Methanomassiliicoccales archaeon]|jgi:hypothetical protein
MNDISNAYPEIRTMDTATFKELLENAEKLANDPEARLAIEKQYTKDGCNCFVDNLGIVHFCSASIYITSRANTALNYWSNQV